MKPSILFVHAHTPDTPLFTQFYNYVSRPDSPLDARIYSEDVNMPIQRMVEAKFGGLPPRFILRGLPLGNAIRISADYIRKNGIKIILELGDTYNFVWDNPESPYLELSVGDIEVDYLIARWRKTEGYEEEETLRRFMDKKKQLRRAELIYVPWGINPEIYEGAPLKRDIDVSLLGRYYHKRNVVREALFRLREKGFKVVLSKFPIPLVDETYGDKYINLLRRSKIFLTLGGHRARHVFLTQKFLEGAVCGAMLLGDIPYTGKDVFEDGVSIVELKDAQGRSLLEVDALTRLKGYSSADRQIQYYLEHDEKRRRIALEGRRRVLETFSLDKVTKEFVDVLKG